MKRLLVLALFAGFAALVPSGDIVPINMGDGLKAQKVGGFKARSRARPSGARSRTRSRPSTRPATRPSTRPSSRPSTLPSTRPSTRPSVPEGNRPSRPDTSRPDRPVYGPVDTGSQGANRPSTRPAANRPSTGRTRPVARPARPIGRPITRPPGWRPPYYRPPLWRPPLYRPPYYPPPYYRPPHYYWGSYYWGPRWGWYFTASLATSTLVYVATLPEEDECERAEMEDETVYICDGVLYRATYYKDEQVYEIVSEPDEVVDADGASTQAASG